MIDVLRLLQAVGFSGTGWKARKSLLKADGVGIEQLLDAFAVRGFQDEAGVMIFVHAISDFGIAIGICVGMFLAREAEDDAGVIFSRRWQLVRILPCSDFEARPFAP